MKSFLSVGAAALVFGTVSTMVACGGGSSSDGSQLLGDNGSSTDIPEISDSGVSESDLEGTACSNPGDSIVCHDTLVVIDGFRYCDGNRSCDADSGLWGACVNTLLTSTGSDGG